MKNLTKYDISLISIRLLVIYLVLQAVYTIPRWAGTIVLVFFKDIQSGSYPLFYKIFVILMPTLALAMPILFWSLSPKIAKFIAKEPSSKNTVYSEAKNLQSIIFSAVGMFILITTIPEIFGWLYEAIRAYNMKVQLFDPQWPLASDIISLSLKVLFSLILALKANTVSKILHKLWRNDK